jgi:hypothetical protein
MERTLSVKVVLHERRENWSDFCCNICLHCIDWAAQGIAWIHNQRLLQIAVTCCSTLRIVIVVIVFDELFDIFIDDRVHGFSEQHIEHGLNGNDFILK